MMVELSDCGGEINQTAEEDPAGTTLAAACLWGGAAAVLMCRAGVVTINDIHVCGTPIIACFCSYHNMLLQQCVINHKVKLHMQATCKRYNVTSFLKSITHFIF